MGQKAASVYSFSSRILLAIVFLGVLLHAQSPGQKAPQNIFDEQAASRMFLQMSEALQGHSQKQFLALFDLDKMKDGASFKQQISSFYGQTESIRVHMNLGEITIEGESTTVSVDAEMEAEPRNGGPIAHQNETIIFTVVNGGGWKFTDVQPRSFFSLP
jgi:acyl-CoA synthetase (AMP-forming)/AMP-acid ligase II